MKKGFFITGTDTGIGKTTATLALMNAFQQHGLTVAGMKPIASGCQQTPEGLRNEDALLLQQHASIQLPYEVINPYAFEPPIAPHIAAAQADITISIEHIVNCYNEIASQTDMVLVEGVGGWLVPISTAQTLAHLAQALSLPVINVVGIRLGCLNHALLTHESILSHQCAAAGWIANQPDIKTECKIEIVNILQERLKANYLGDIPYLDNVNNINLGTSLNISSLLA